MGYWSSRPLSFSGSRSEECPCENLGTIEIISLLEGVMVPPTGEFRRREASRKYTNKRQLNDKNWVGTSSRL